MPSQYAREEAFSTYHTTNGARHYAFSLQLRKGGGFLKAKRLRWFVAYQDYKELRAFEVDGKHFTVREVVDGNQRNCRRCHSIGSLMNMWASTSRETEFCQCPVAIGGRNLADMGPVRQSWRAISPGKVGILILGNDEVGVSTVRSSGEINGILLQPAGNHTINRGRTSILPGVANQSTDGDSELSVLQNIRYV